MKRRHQLEAGICYPAKLGNKNGKKESMKPVSQAVVELDDEALDQVSGGLKRLDSDWKPEITEVCKLCGSTRNVRGGLCLACKNKC